MVGGDEINRRRRTMTQETHGALDAALRQPMLLGLFLPIQSGGWSRSTAPRSTDWRFDYNKRLALKAEALGFDLCFGVAGWIGKGGYGGVTRYAETSLDPFVTAAALAAVTRRILLLSTIHVLYGPLHPLHLAKFGATLDHISGGRWGINVVNGQFAWERAMFGQEETPHAERYAEAATFLDLMLLLMRSEENVTVKAGRWDLREAFVTPKPVHGRPIIVNAGASRAAMAFAARYSDIMFITSPAGAEIEAALAALPAHTAEIREVVGAAGRRVPTLINPLVVCRETEAEALAAYDAIIAAEDTGAVEGLTGAMRDKKESTAFKGHSRHDLIAGGNIRLVGSPEQIVDWFIRLRRAGCDGVQLSFFDFEPELDFFGRRVLPLMEQAGLRLPLLPDPETRS
jgi:FMNH2-dependent dimethyl sulfone monooxygenase